MIKSKRFTLVKVSMIVVLLAAIVAIEVVVFKGLQRHNQIKPESTQDKNLRKEVGQALTFHPD